MEPWGNDHDDEVKLQYVVVAKKIELHEKRERSEGPRSLTLFIGAASWV